MGDTSHVFLSHEGLEAESARTLARTLRASGIKVWLDVDDLKPGKLWVSELEAALVRSSSFVIYIGTNGISSWVDRELRLAIDRNTKDPSFRIYPVLGHGAKPDLLPAFLQQHQWVDLRAPAQADNAIRTLVAELQGPAILIAPEVVSQRCPFLGLLPFSAEDGALYFGRDAEVHSTLNALQDSSVVAVIGDSGSGKTSLVHAGVVPALQRGRFYSDDKWVHAWRVAICRPGESPFAEMANALPDLESDLSTSERLKLRDQCELSLKVGPEGLANCLAMLSAPHDRHTLIVVDQFEELFTLSKTRESRLAFITSLVTAARSRGPYGVRLLLCLRSDFYPHCLEYEELVEWVSQHQVVLARPGQQQLRDVIEKPSKASSLKFESGLVDRILRDVVDEPGGLPMLGHALLQLWERRDGSSLTHRAYGDIGGVGGALKNHADAVFRSLSPEGQLFARKLLVRLTHVGVATVETRRRIPKDAILQLGTDRQLAEQVLNTLLAERLLVVTQAPTFAPQAAQSLSLGRWQVEHDVIEVAHEALIRNWPLLQAWLDEDREAILIERRVHQATTEWLATERDPHQLYRGARLSQAEAWAEQYRGDVNADQSAFLVASRDQEDQDARDERTRRLRDKRRIQAVTLLAVVAVVGLVVAAQQSLVAKERMRITRAQDLADQAVRTLEGRGDALRGLMYAVEAGRTAQTPPVWDALRRALRAPYVKVILRHGDQRMAGLSGVLFTPDGRFAITLGDGGGKIWDVKTGRQVHSLLPGERNLSRVALDHKGQVMAVPTADGRLRLLDISSLAVLREWPVANGYLRDFVFAPDDARVATIGEDGIVRLWDSATGMLVRSLPRVGYATITFSPDGEKLATLSPDGITLWRISDGHVVARLRDVVCCVYSMSFSPDNSMFAGAARDGVVHLVSTTHGRDVHTFREAGEGWAYSTMFSRDGRLLVTGGYRGAKVWDVTTGAQLAVLPLQGAFQSMSVRPDGQQVVIATNQAAIVWNAIDGLVSGTLTRLFVNSLVGNDVSYSPDGGLIAISAERGTARLWASDFESELPVLRGGTSDIVSASFSPDGSKIRFFVDLVAGRG